MLFGKNFFFVASLGFLIAAAGCSSIAPKTASNYFDSWAAGDSPREIGGRVAKRFIATPHPNFGFPTPPHDITYPETCTWYGGLTFARVAGDTNLTAQLIERFEPLFGAESKLIPRPVNVDSTVFGAVPLQIYIETKNPKYLELGKMFADKQWEIPEGRARERLKPETLDWIKRGLSWQMRFWIDDMYMITLVETQAYRATGDEKYIDRAAREMVAYLDELQQPDGLFYHAPDVLFFWGRGDGWMAAGMSELLRSLPENHPSRARIMAGYKKMMAALLKYQDANGMWHQLIDRPDAWPETSCSGMFTFAFVTGVKNGWLDAKTYGPAARKAWLGLIKYIDANGDIHEVCEGTNKKNSLQYYLNRKRNIGDMHGQAPVLWCATALLR
ncbi:MAG TPA: glycoside hydrolase family 88 protein [Verrucomicrobiae bacterium]|nr:glycoside hydrolase family 88 protein [Verrucomicrobiae bacterium]